MAKEYIPKQFTPFIYPEWGELFEELTPEQNSEILFAITKFPNYEPKGVPVWKFIKSQLQKDYENFTAKCKKRGEAARTYWGNKGEQMLSNDNKSITNDNKGEPKPLTNNINHLPLTETETETETKIDYLTNPIINKVFSIYQTHCNNLTGLGKYYKRDVELKKQIGLFLEQINKDLEYFTQVCDIANRLKKIGSCKLDLKMVMNNHSGIYNGKYIAEDEEMDDGYSSHDDSEWIKKQAEEEPETWKVIDEDLLKSYREG